MYILKARFSKQNEEPIHPFIAHSVKMSKTKKEREIEFSFKPSLQTIKELVKQHYIEHNGYINSYGEILYYSFFENDKLLYDIDVNGEVINNFHFKDLIIEMYFKNCSNERKKLLRKELIYLNYFMDEYIEFYNYVKKVVNKIDPFMISWVAEDEYDIEIKEIVLDLIGRSLNKKKIYKKVKNIFDKWFYEDESRIDDYWNIANEIYYFYIDKKRAGYWMKKSDI